MRQLESLYSDHFEQTPRHSIPIPKAGSNRQYYRLADNAGNSVIGVVGTDINENRSFIHLCRHFESEGLPVPHIIGVTDDGLRYLQTDLGTTSLYDALSGGRKSGYYSKEDTVLIANTMRQLAHLQVRGGRHLDFNHCLPPIEFDTQAALFDLHYFKYCFLKTTDLGMDEVSLENDFLQMAACLTEDSLSSPTFLYRDFQARNVMLDPQGQPHFIDFQGGMRGPLQYDVASFLWQASAAYPQTLREEMIAEYLDELSTLITIDEEKFREKLRLFVLFRTLQVLGAYGLRGYFERKKYFIDSIPAAIRNLRRLLIDGTCTHYPYLESLLKRLVELERFNPVTDASSDTAPVAKTLRVSVYSFSYKRGIPDDSSGNGGGYVFDCRGTHNPGRYEPYKHLTGLDTPVIQFLEEDGEIIQYLEHIYQIADRHVEQYIQRGFTHLQFAFGCTGGQHRSVYCAQHLAEHLHKTFGIHVDLEHREQNLHTHFSADNSK